MITLLNRGADHSVQDMTVRFTHFHEVNFFTIAINCDSEIGEGMSISFQLFNDAEEDDTSINITDPSIW